MKLKTLVLAAIVCGSTSSLFGATLLEFDFIGATNTVASNTQASTFSATGVHASSMTRGAGISNNNAANSFRGTGFSNNGIALANTDFFQFTLAANTTLNPLNRLTINSIYGNFNGTSSFSANPGVTMAYAYSLDGGTTFTQMGTFTRIGSGTHTYTLTVGELATLTEVNSVVFRLLASGQTPTGGWGLQSAASAGTIGLSVEGSLVVIPEPHEYALMIAGLLGVIVVMRRMRRNASVTA